MKARRDFKSDFDLRIKGNYKVAIIEDDPIDYQNVISNIKRSSFKDILHIVDLGVTTKKTKQSFALNLIEAENRADIYIADWELEFKKGRAYLRSLFDEISTHSREFPFTSKFWIFISHSEKAGKQSDFVNIFFKAGNKNFSQPGKAIMTDTSDHKPVFRFDNFIEQAIAFLEENKAPSEIKNIVENSEIEFVIDGSEVQARFHHLGLPPKYSRLYTIWSSKKRIVCLATSGGKKGILVLVDDKSTVQFYFTNAHNTTKTLISYLGLEATRNSKDGFYYNPIFFKSKRRPVLKREFYGGFHKRFFLVENLKMFETYNNDANGELEGYNGWFRGAFKFHERDDISRLIETLKRHHIGM